MSRPVPRMRGAAVMSALLLAACSERGVTPRASLPGGTAAAADAAPPAVRVAPATRVTVPDEELVDQDGAPVRLRELLQGQVAVVNFVFTTCTTICSPMTAVFAKLQRELDRAALGRDVRLVTVSLDPAVDTPERLKRYADQFDRRPGWSFLTGRPERVGRVLRALGGSAPIREQHAPFTLIGSTAEGRWTRVDGVAPAERLLAEVRAFVEDRGAGARGAAR